MFKPGILSPPNRRTFSSKPLLAWMMMFALLCDIVTSTSTPPATGPGAPVQPNNASNSEPNLRTDCFYSVVMNGQTSAIVLTRCLGGSICCFTIDTHGGPNSGIHKHPTFLAGIEHLKKVSGNATDDNISVGEVKYSDLEEFKRTGMPVQAEKSNVGANRKRLFETAEYLWRWRDTQLQQAYQYKGFAPTLRTRDKFRGQPDPSQWELPTYTNALDQMTKWIDDMGYALKLAAIQRLQTSHGKRKPICNDDLIVSTYYSDSNNCLAYRTPVLENGQGGDLLMLDNEWADLFTTYKVWLAEKQKVGYDPMYGLGKEPENCAMIEDLDIMKTIRANNAVVIAQDQDLAAALAASLGTATEDEKNNVEVVSAQRYAAPEPVEPRVEANTGFGTIVPPISQGDIIRALIEHVDHIFDESVRQNTTICTLLSAFLALKWRNITGPKDGKNLGQEFATNIKATSYGVNQLNEPLLPGVLKEVWLSVNYFKRWEIASNTSIAYFATTLAVTVARWRNPNDPANADPRSGVQEEKMADASPPPSVQSGPSSVQPPSPVHQSQRVESVRSQPQDLARSDMNIQDAIQQSEANAQIDARNAKALKEMMEQSRREAGNRAQPVREQPTPETGPRTARDGLARQRPERNQEVPWQDGQDRERKRDKIVQRAENSRSAHDEDDYKEDVFESRESPTQTRVRYTGTTSREFYKNGRMQRQSMEFNIMELSQNTESSRQRNASASESSEQNLSDSADAVKAIAAVARNESESKRITQRLVDSEWRSGGPTQARPSGSKRANQRTSKSNQSTSQGSQVNTVPRAGATPAQPKGETTSTQVVSESTNKPALPEIKLKELEGKKKELEKLQQQLRERKKGLEGWERKEFRKIKRDLRQSVKAQENLIKEHQRNFIGDIIEEDGLIEETAVNGNDDPIPDGFESHAEHKKWLLMQEFLIKQCNALDEIKQRNSSNPTSSQKPGAPKGASHNEPSEDQY